MCECKSDETLCTMDIKTPINAPLSAFYKRSFAYYTVKERLPKILTQTIDILVRHKEDIGRKYGVEAAEELKTVIGEISKLKYEIQTNKPLREIEVDSSSAKFYNNYLAEQTNKTHFSTIWLHTECYMYRRLQEIFELTETLKNYDYFQVQKQESYTTNLSAMAQLSTYLLSVLNGKSDDIDIQDEFIKLLKFNLWGNKCDLSFSNGLVEAAQDPFELLKLFEPNILSDHSKEVWNAVSDLTTESQIIDIVFDNSGYEVFTDLCIADFLITHGLAQSMRFYVKTFPWFVSDVTLQDFNWTLDQLQKSEVASLRTLGQRWNTYVKKKTWTIIEDDFFTYPVDFSRMRTEGTQLYEKLAEAKFIIFKGDLNYRKLFGEKNWEYNTPCYVALQGFNPAKLCTLRTIKCHIVCGLEDGVGEHLDIKEPDWLQIGKYGLIQYCNDVVC